MITVVLIIFAAMTVQSVGTGVAMAVQKDKECRKEHLMTRMTGPTLEMFCE